MKLQRRKCIQIIQSYIISKIMFKACLNSLLTVLQLIRTALLANRQFSKLIKHFRVRPRKNLLWIRRQIKRWRINKSHKMTHPRFLICTIHLESQTKWYLTTLSFIKMHKIVKYRAQESISLALEQVKAQKVCKLWWICQRHQLKRKNKLFLIHSMNKLTVH